MTAGHNPKEKNPREGKRKPGGIIAKLITVLGGKFSSALGIDLSQGNSREVFKWFLASKLFGARISSNIAGKTYREFEKRDVLSPDKVLRAGWDGLVKILDDGGYARYDFSTATKLLAIVKDLKKDYDGDLNRLYRSARDEAHLEELLKDLGTGIGDVTVNIFLRELRTVWDKARPNPSGPALLAAGNLGLIKPGENSLAVLQKVWSKHKIQGRDFCDLEAALVRLGKDYCKRLRCEACPMGTDCPCRSALRRA